MLNANEIEGYELSYNCGRQAGKISVKELTYTLHVFGECVFFVVTVDTDGLPSQPGVVSRAIAPPAPKWIK